MNIYVNYVFFKKTLRGRERRKCKGENELE
jgi:hypothetical protein